MSWKDLLQANEPDVIAPWVGGRTLLVGPRLRVIDGRRPLEHGWYSFTSRGKFASDPRAAEPQPDVLGWMVHGYLVGDRLIADDVMVDPDPTKIVEQSERVHLIEPGVDRFTRITAGRAFEHGALIYAAPLMPLGPEDDVLGAFLDQRTTLANIKQVTPALHAAFNLETWHRTETLRRREELERERERLRREEEARLEAEQIQLAQARRRQELIENLGNSVTRRALTTVDFAEAARAALVVGGATYLDHRPIGRSEQAVRFRLDHRRFECIVDTKTLKIVDAGVCLTDHRTGQKGDTLFTLESLPGVILEADRLNKLVIFRHA